VNQHRLIFQWQISTAFGWGVYGLNLALHAAGQGFQVTTTSPVPLDRMALDAARLWALDGFIRRSQILTDALRHRRDRVDASEHIVLQPLGNQLKVAKHIEATLIGKRNIGIAFFEDSALDAGGRRRGLAFDRVIAGSRWNAELLRAHGLDNVDLVWQGIDPSLFHPAPRLGLFKGRFSIFSGGKLERRKGQDIVLEAFRLFHQRHPDALLVTAWHSPWSAQAARDVSAIPGVAAVPLNAIGEPDVRGWVEASGLDAESVIDLGVVPNGQMPPLLREMDAALFPNRCEGGTNLVAMEAMACGVPVVLSANTGHLDLIEPGNSYPLHRQSAVKPVPGIGTDGWGESDPEEIVEALEAIYTDRQTAGKRAAAVAAQMAGLTWQSQIGQLLKAVV